MKKDWLMIVTGFNLCLLFIATILLSIEFGARIGIAVGIIVYLVVDILVQIRQVLMAR